MVCGQKDNNEVLCSGARDCVFQGSAKQDYSDISEVCYFRCIKTDNLKGKD